MKKALVVGINDFGSVAPELEAPKGEMERWASLLTGVYQFDPVNVETYLSPRGEKPTRASVMSDLRWLLTGAQPGDQLVFYYGGHGSMVNGRDANGTPTSKVEEGIVLYSDDTDLQAATLSSSDLVLLIREVGVPPGTAFTIILDACFAGALDVSPHGAKPLFVASRLHRDGSASGDGAGNGLHRFASIRHPEPADGASGWPIIVAASSPSETAFEIPQNHRLLFSERALDELGHHGDDTYDQLIAKVSPLANGIPQQPMLTGDVSRRNRTFLA